jgi:hypothetical protein
MKKKTNKSQPDDILPEYNLEGKKGVRGKYARAMQGDILYAYGMKMAVSLYGTLFLKKIQFSLIWMSKRTFRIQKV